MQSKKSFFNMALFKKNISRTWIVGLLYFILLLIMIPISNIIELANFDNSYYISEGYTKQYLMYDKLTYMPKAEIGCVVAIIVGGITFSYLFFKRDNYMMHSFPVSRRSLFFTGFLSASVVSLVPVILTAAITTAVSIAEKAIAVDAIWYWTLIVAVSTELFLSLAMFAFMSSGQIVTSIIFYFIYMHLYLLMEVAFRLTAELLMFGMGQATSEIAFNLWSPLEFIENNIGVSTSIVFDSNGAFGGFSYTLSGVKYLGIYAIAAVVILIIAYQMYRFKKLETVQDFIGPAFLKPIFTIGMTFFISMVAGAFVASMIKAVKPLSYSANFAIAIISALIIGCLLFYATQMMIEKTIRVFKAKNFGFMLGYSVVALAFLLCLRNDVFNVENKVPKAEDIAWVGISNDYTMVFTDEQDIQSVRELHRNLLKDKKELRDVNLTYEDVDGSMLTVRYKLKNGKQMTRQYSVVDTYSDQVSAEYMAATQPIVDYLNNPDRIKQHIIGNIWDDCTIISMQFSTYRYNENRQDFDVYTQSYDDLSTTEKTPKFEKVYKAFLKDIDEGKVFVTDFGRAGVYTDNGTNLYNDFNFTVENKRVPYFSDEDTFWNYGDYESYDRNIYASLNRDCTNTLKALKEEEFYFEDSDILTYDEYNRTMGYGDEDFVADPL